MADLTVLDEKAQWEAKVERLWTTRPSRWRDAWYELSRNKLAVAGSNLCPPLRKKGLVPGTCRGEALRALVHQVELMQWAMQMGSAGRGRNQWPSWI